MIEVKNWRRKQISVEWICFHIIPMYVHCKHTFVNVLTVKERKNQLSIKNLAVKNSFILDVNLIYLIFREQIIIFLLCWVFFFTIRKPSNIFPIVIRLWEHTHLVFSAEFRSSFLYTFNVFTMTQLWAKTQPISSMPSK